MNQKNGIIYISTNLINGKQYVGQTVQKLRNRIACHKYEVKKNIKNSSIFHNAINKYDLKNFKWVSFSCPEEELDWQENFLIKELNTLSPNGYNLDNGGHGNKHHHELTKQKMKDNHWDCSGVNNPQFGKLRPSEHRKHLSESLKGIHSSPKTEFKKGNLSWNKGKKCPQLSGENNPSARPVVLISPEKQEYKLSCYAPFCKEHNLNHGNICGVLQGKRKQHKGWTGKYIDNDK